MLVFIALIFGTATWGSCKRYIRRPNDKYALGWLVAAVLLLSMALAII